MLTRLLIMIFVICIFFWSALASVENRIDVERVQTILKELCYNPGPIDGVWGPKTEGEIYSLFSKFNKIYDGEFGVKEMTILEDFHSNYSSKCVSIKNKRDNELTSKDRQLIKKFTNKTLSFSTNHIATEIHLMDSADINKDGVDDFIIGLQVDSFAQLGIECCKVPKERLKEIKQLSSYIVYSHSDGFKIEKIPESESLRTWAAEFFFFNGNTYLYLGKNGEMGLPKQNPGEKSLLYKINVSKEKIYFKKIWEADKPTITASISTFAVDEFVYILESNYGSRNIVQRPVNPNTTVLYKMDKEETITGVNLLDRLKPKSADNMLKMVDYDDDGKIDLLAANEVWKTLNGKKILSPWAGSYLVDNFLFRKAKIKLDPPSFEKDHAGMSIALLRDKDKTIIIEAATGFLGHKGGGFKGAKLSAYDTKNNFSSVAITGRLNSKKGSHSKKIHVFPHFGSEKATINYSNTPQVISIKENGGVDIINMPIKNYDSSHKFSSIIPLNVGKCVAFVTMGNRQKSKKLSFKISTCLLNS